MLPSSETLNTRFVLRGEAESCVGQPSIQATESGRTDIKAAGIGLVSMIGYGAFHNGFAPNPQPAGFHSFHDKPSYGLTLLMLVISPQPLELL
jgi:hypothetical protein